MINLRLLSALNLDELLSREVALFLDISDNDAFCTSTRLRLKLLQYAQHVLRFAVELVKVIDTENGRVVLRMLANKQREISAVEGAVTVGFVSMGELPSCQQVFETVHQKRVKLMRRCGAYDQARKINAPETCIFKFGKLLCLMGGNCVGICNAVLELSAPPHLQLCPDRLFKMDFLTDVEFTRTPWFMQKADEWQRLEFLGGLGQRAVHSWEHRNHLESGDVFVALSPWDRTHVLGFLIVNRDILKPRAQLEEECKGRMRAEAAGTGWMDPSPTEPMLYLDHIEVCIENRNCGIGTRMIKWVKRMAEAKGFREIALGGDAGSGSWAFLRKLDFQPCELIDCKTAILYA